MNPPLVADPTDAEAGKAGEVAGLRAQLADLQAQLASEREALQRVRAVDLLAQVGDAVVAVDTARRLVFVNAAAERQYGVRAAEVLGAPDSALFEPLWRDDAARDAANEALHSRGEWRGDCTHRLHDGRLLPVEASVSLWRDAAGAVIGRVSVLRDVSARQQAEVQLRERTAGLAVLARASQALVLAGATDAAQHGVFVELAHALGMELLFHYRLGAVAHTLEIAGSLGLSAARREQVAQLDFGQMLCGRVAATREVLVVEDLQGTLDAALLKQCPADMRLYVGVPLIAQGELLGTAGFATSRRDRLRDGELQLIRAVCDMAAAQQARAFGERRLREQAGHLALAMDASVAVVFEWDIVHDRVRRVHSGEKALPATSPDDPRPATLAQMMQSVHPADREDFQAQLQQAMRSADGRYRSEFRVVRPDGTVRWFGDSGRVDFDAEQRPLRLMGISMDITLRKEAEAAVRASEERLRLALKATHDLVWEWSADSDRMTWNEAGVELLGWTEPATDGVPMQWWLDRVHPQDLQHVQDLLRQAEADPAREFLEDEYRLLHRAGHHVRVSDCAYVVRDVQGRITRMVGTMQDVSERRRAEEALRQVTERFEAALQASQVVVFNQDRELRYTWIHNMALGFQAQQVIGLRDSELFERAEDAQRTEAVKREVLTTGTPRRVEVVVSHQGEERCFDLSVQPQHDAAGAIVGVACAAVDITERKRATQALHEQARRKDEFLAMLAHELRNPLAPIRTTVGILATPGIGPAQIARCRDIIDRQSTQMARLLDELLDASRLSLGKVTLRRQRVALKDVLEAAIETSRPLVDQRAQQLVVAPVDPRLALDADAARLTQVFANLLNNASKYSHAGGRIELQVQPAGTQVRVCVRDAGIGIAPELQERVFDLFVQGSDASHQVPGGLGIGLSLARRLVEMHEGRITLSSGGSGQGSEFCVSLPRLVDALDGADADPALDGTPPIASTLARLPGRRRVLVVDDNVDAADTTALLLEAVGCEVMVAYGGDLAVHEAARLRPDVVILDLGMRGVDGFEACRRIRAQPWAVAVKLVALSGWGQLDDRRRSAAAGFDLHLTKPADPARLIAAVRAPDR